jgi:hypothetical protein
MVVFGQNQIDAGSLEVAAEQQLGVGNNNGIGGSVRGRAIDVSKRNGMRDRSFSRQLGVEFTYKIQWATKKG